MFGAVPAEEFPVLARSRFVLFALLPLCLTWVLACGPTASGDAQCGAFDLTQNGPPEMCSSMSACPGTDLCVGGFCVGSVCEAGTCESVGTAYACVTPPADSGASTDAGADAPADSPSPDAGTDASKDAAAGQ
jgi:hypothetical protein